jgi:electron transport complex protein RnfG
MKQMLKLGFVLAAFASVACVCLALVNNVTAPAIAVAKEAKANMGMKVVFADADSFEKVADITKNAADVTALNNTLTTNPVKINSINLAKKGSDVIGCVIEAVGPTYDKATMLIGMDLNRTITGIQFLALSDTPGFGQKAAEPSWMAQFAGKSAVEPLEAGVNFDTISGATITTKGIASLINFAVYVGGEYLAANHGGLAGNGAAPVAAKVAEPFSYPDALFDMFSQETYQELIMNPIREDISALAVSHNMEVTKAFVIKNGETVLGAAVGVLGIGYHGQGIVLTAVDLNRTIIGSRIIQLEDTPKIGQRALEEEFYSQFTGKSADDNLWVNSDEQHPVENPDVDTLSGATITSGCVADMVKVGAFTAAQWLADNVGGKAGAAGSENFEINGLFLDE